VARELAVRRVIVPQAPAHFSAFGMLLADLRRDYVLTHFSKLADLQMAELERLYQGLEQEGRAALAEAGIQPGQAMMERAADMRYVGQEHSVAINVPASVESEDVRAQIKQAFDEAHEVRFSHSAPEEPAELVSLRLSVFGRLDKPELPKAAAGGGEPPHAARRGSREVVLDGAAQAVSCAIFDRRQLLAGNVVRGPAVIEEPASSTLLGPGDRAEVNEFGHLVIELA
jgi:N-methylhydantoinase A